MYEDRLRRSDVRPLLEKPESALFWSHAQQKNKDPVMYTEQKREHLIPNEKAIPAAIWKKFGSEVAPSQKGSVSTGLSNDDDDDEETGRQRIGF